MARIRKVGSSKRYVRVTSNGVSYGTEDQRVYVGGPTVTGNEETLIKQLVTRKVAYGDPLASIMSK